MSKKNKRLNKKKRASPVVNKQAAYVNKQARKLPTRLSTVEVGQPGIVSGSYFIQDSRKTELAMPRRLCTFDVMTQDDAVSNSVNFTNMLVFNALYNGNIVPGRSESSKSKIAADALNYIIHNMSCCTWKNFCTNLCTDLKYGFSIANIVTEKIKNGKYKGSVGLKKLAPRCQKSVYGWVWDDKMRDYQGFIQRKNLIQKHNTTGKTGRNSGNFAGNLNLLNAGKYYEMGYPFLKKDQLIHSTYNSTCNNPQGFSPLMDCYNAWAEKKLIEKYELSAITKGLGGVLLLRLPSELIERANDPQGRFPEATKEYIDLQKDAAAIHNAENALMVLTSDVDEITKSPLYDVRFLGVEGGGSLKNFDTTKIIDQKRKAIYNTFLTGAILLGQGDTGSYALSTNITSMHGLAVENNILQKVDTINTQLIPALLAVNDVELDWEDVPVFEPISPNEVDLAIVSAAVQRMKSVGAMTPEALRTVYEELGWPTDGIEDLVFDDGDTSRSGDGMETPGEGTSNSVGDKNGGDASVSNVANKSLSNEEDVKDFVIDGKYIVDVETDTPLEDVILEGGD